MNLTQNFTLSEMTKSETALRFGMANDPSETEIENMRFGLCENVLQKCVTTTAWASRSTAGTGIPSLTPR
jgi:hypothetical protein